MYTKEELLVGDDGKPKRLPWEDWREGEDLMTSGWVRATAPSGDADFVGEVGWSGELGYGTRARGGSSAVSRVSHIWARFVPIRPSGRDPSRNPRRSPPRSWGGGWARVDLIVFIVASAMVLGGAFGVVVYRHPVHCALSLVLTLFGVAVHFVAMEAHFLAAVQVIVYAGAIVVLFLFVIMLLGVDTAEDLRIDPLPIQRPLAAVMGVGIVGLLIAAVVSTRDTPPLSVSSGLAVAGQESADGSVAGHDANINQLADNLFSDQVFAFELTSVLLIVAVAGTVILTRREKREP